MTVRKGCAPSRSGRAGRGAGRETSIIYGMPHAALRRRHRSGPSTPGDAPRVTDLLTFKAAVSCDAPSHELSVETEALEALEVTHLSVASSNTSSQL